MRHQLRIRSGSARDRYQFLRILFLLVVLASFPLSQLWGQQPSAGTVSGTVTDPEGRPAAEVTVTLSRTEPAVLSRTTITDGAGGWRFDGVAPGTVEIRTRRLGFAETFRTLVVGAGEDVVLNLSLTTDAVQLEAVLVEAERARERARFETQAGVTARVIEVATVRLLPGLAEPDVVRAVTVLPGVITTSDFSSSYNVRGGSADQNLITIDGFTVFNPFHLGGLFSVFNSDAVARAELFSGGFGAEYGGRVSSVLNIESRADIPEEFNVEGGVSLLATRLLLHAPMPASIATALGGDEGSWFVSARRSYFDQVLRPVADFPYHLTDLQTYASVETPLGGRVALTGYWGEDVLDLSGIGLSDGDAADVLRIRWKWGNRVIGATWLQPLANDWLLDSRLGYSRYGDEMNFLDFGDVRFSSEIDQINLRTSLSREFSPSLWVSAGLSAEFTDHANLADAGGTTFFASEGDGVLGAAHFSLRWNPTPSWIVEPGVRADAWMASDTTRRVVSPRLAVKRFLGADRNFALKFAAGRYTQFIHSVRDEELPISNDTWILANRSIPHVTSDQFQVGVEAFLSGGWSASVEAYARRFDGVTEFNTGEDPNDPTDDLLIGSGVSQGVDMMLRRSVGSLTGWAALSYLRAERTFPDPLAAGWEDLPGTVTYAPIFDRRVNLDLTFQYLTEGGFEIGGRWNLGSGLPYTRPTAQYFGWSHNPVTGGSEPLGAGPGADDGDNDLPVAVVLGPRNAERYPAYHRLDVTIRRPIERAWGSYVPYLQVLNVYNRRNVLFYFFDYGASPPVRSGFSMFPLLPAIGVEVSF